MSKLLSVSPSQEGTSTDILWLYRLSQKHMIIPHSLVPPLSTLVLGAVLSNPAAFADSKCHLARGKKLGCLLSEQHDNNGTTRSSRKSKFSTDTQKSCDLSQVLLKALNT